MFCRAASDTAVSSLIVNENDIALYVNISFLDISANYEKSDECS
jgi:hypothetical protein